MAFEITKMSWLSVGPSIACPGRISILILVGLSICRLYNLTPSELFYRYEAFVMSRPSGLRAKLSTISLRSARDMRSELQREQQAKIVASSASAGGSDLTPKPGAGIRRGRGNMGDLGGL